MSTSVKILLQSRNGISCLPGLRKKHTATRQYTLTLILLVPFLQLRAAPQRRRTRPLVSGRNRCRRSPLFRRGHLAVQLRHPRGNLPPYCRFQTRHMSQTLPHLAHSIASLNGKKALQTCHGPPRPDRQSTLLWPTAIPGKRSRRQALKVY